MTSLLRLILLAIPFLLLGGWAKHEFSKPTQDAQMEALEDQLRAQGKIADLEPAAFEDLAKSGLPYQRPALLFVLMLGAVCAGGLWLLKGLIPVYRDGLQHVFLDTSGQTGYMKAKVLVTAEKYPEAIAMLREYRKTNPEDVRAILETVRIQEQLQDDLPAALATLEAAVNDKSTEEGHAALCALRLAELHHQRLGNLEQAKRWAQELMDRFPSTPQAGQAGNLLQQITEAEWRSRQG